MTAVKFITFRLSEMERDTFIMLKTVKRKMGEREEGGGGEQTRQQQPQQQQQIPSSSPPSQPPSKSQTQPQKQMISIDMEQDII
jgi:hypothetical protein